MEQDPEIIIIGASVRAAAHSALRAGFRPLCADLFADRDLASITSCRRTSLDQYPEGLVKLIAENSRSPWMYTGGLENYPQLIDEWSKRSTLYGNKADQIHLVRDPKRLADRLARNGVSFPPIGPPVGERKYLVKPVRSGGGRGIRFWNGESLTEGEYLQGFVGDESISAVFLCDRTQATFFGASKQLIGLEWLHAQEFQYCGSIGPLIVGDEWEGVRRTLNECNLVGLVGVDAILTNGNLIVIEINPRYTASVEVIEHATGLRLLEQHFSVFGHQAEPMSAQDVQPVCVGKGIYFAPHPLTIPNGGPWDDELRKTFDPWRLPKYADVPQPGSWIEARDPVITVFASASTPRDCLQILQESAHQLDRLFA
jgi:uncharacterized protein